MLGKVSVLGVELRTPSRYIKIMSDKIRSYPDNSDIFARKMAGRRKLASLSFSEKLALLDNLKERVEPIRQARSRRQKQGLLKQA